ncbi:S-formylglutathione hydrol [Ascobolus immersus RN42]|uniref:S-formylglutathione hydrolase n=1 Tax=Ascobolus immersus RN42 TaxID=1160509 RepID=A0A3N4HS27_ASCIM|nr:S-formylglutathione hydrol [Ascobolus immersus RN42]
MGGLTVTSSIKSFGGTLHKLSHDSTSTGTKMALNLFIPPAPPREPIKMPLLVYLSGLTCTGDNCAEKGFIQPHAVKYGIAVAYPDTSPRGAGVEGEDKDWDFGTGAGFYIDATNPPYDKNYKMYTYITKELPALLKEHYQEIDTERVSLMGHSMGGHGAMSIYLKNPGKYLSCSAFAPIANPVACPWGQKAFTGYFGPPPPTSSVESPTPSIWQQHDSTHLIKSYPQDTPMAIKIDVGTADKFYQDGQLLVENFEKAAREAKWGEAYVEVKKRDGYDHSYYFVSSFVKDHVDFHATFLLGVGQRRPDGLVVGEGAYQV